MTEGNLTGNESDLTETVLRGPVWPLSATRWVNWMTALPHVKAIWPDVEESWEPTGNDQYYYILLWELLNYLDPYSKVKIMGTN